ncbi:GNAT family N-acetyltransferase, partial [Bacteroides acidifaciens]|uniref:GNAT family N-acetyltransferase n=1 Tax=Bacteroides acidifaciens TaxID=85831 RepID=UPI0025754FDD
DIYGAFDKHLLIGIIGVHWEKQHISLFFVLSHYHRQGIGKSLFGYMMSNCNFTYITVNSSTYAEPFYASLGFKKVGEKELNKGIVSIPMERNI